MIALVTNKSTPSICHRLVDITDDRRTVTILASNEKFSYNNFFEVNQVCHLIDEDITVADALKLLESTFDPTWYEQKRNDPEISPEHLELIKQSQERRKSDIEYLTYIQ